MSYTMIKLLLIVFLSLEINILRNKFAEGCFLSPKRTVHIVSNLPINSSKLKVHCWSKDDELGYHLLDTAQEFKWSFCGSFWGDTLFACHFWWGSKDRALDVFVQEPIDFGTPSLYWVPQSDGIYFANAYHFPNDLKKKYDWNN
ncbi:hypothetical protein ACP275_06G190400 [Erythranthe tilingii]